MRAELQRILQVFWQDAAQVAAQLAAQVAAQLAAQVAPQVAPQLTLHEPSQLLNSVNTGQSSSNERHLTVRVMAPPAALSNSVSVRLRMEVEVKPSFDFLDIRFPFGFAGANWLQNRQTRTAKTCTVRVGHSSC